MNIYEHAELKRLCHDMAQTGWQAVMYAGDTPNTWPDIGIKNEQGDIAFNLEKRHGQSWRASIPTKGLRKCTPSRETAMAAVADALTWIQDNPAEHQPMRGVTRNPQERTMPRSERA